MIPIPAQEIADLLLRVVHNEAKITLEETSSWDDIYCGNVLFTVDGWSIAIYNDCAELDYIDRAVAPDGRVGEFEEWFDSCGGGPLDLLSAEELGKLEIIVESLEAAR